MQSKNPFYKEQAEQFLDYASKFHDRELLPIFDEWAESKDIFGVNKHEIWRIARRGKPPHELIISDNSESFVSISAVLDILLQHDLAYLNKLMDKEDK